VTDVQGPAEADASGGGDLPRSSNEPTLGTEPTSAPGPNDALQAVPAEVVRQSGDAIMVSDSAYVVHAWNPAAERLYGISAADAIGREVGDLWGSFQVDGSPLDLRTQRGALERDGSWRGRIVQRPTTGRHAGRDVIVDTVATVLRDAAGTVSGILVINRDVSASARVEAEMATLGSLVVATDRARSKSEVAEAALDILCRTTGAEAGLVTSMDRAYEATAQRGVGQATIDIILAYGQLGGPLAQALQPAEAFISADVATAPLREDVRAAVIAEGIQHLVVVGLHLSGRLLGLLALGWRQPVANPPSKAIVLQAAALIAAAMENARLLEAVESGLAQERTLTRRFRALLELTRLPDAAPIDGLGLERLVADIGSIIGADSAIFARVDGDRLTSVAIHRVEPGHAEPLLDWPRIDLAVKARLKRGHPTFITPTAPEPIGSEAAGEHLGAGYRTVAAFPIREDGRLTALLFSLFEAPIEELDIDERTLEAIGRVLDISFVNRSLRQVVASSETRYRALFERSPDALLVESADGIVLDNNPAARRLYGGDLVGRHVDELVEGGRGYLDTGSEEFRRHGIVDHTGIGRRLDGSTFPKEIDLHPLVIEGEARVLAIVRDMTERTRLQGELIQAQKMEAIGLLVAGVAHELNNPLASIVAFSQLLRTDPELPEDLRRQAEMLVQEANRTRVIVQNLLDFARARPAERLPTDLRPLVDSVMVLQSYSFGKGGLEVIVDIPADLPPILLDRAQMQQVLVNLTVNAAQAIHDSGVGGRLRIAATTAVSADLGDVVRIEISDNGPGVAPELLDRLFMPFVTSKAPGKGTGLGLSVSFGIVTGHGGTLRHETGPDGRGTTFIIELPLGAEAAEVPAAGPSGFAGLASAAIGETGAVQPVGAESPASADGDGAHQRPIRVLVLDDETAIREFLGRALRRAGYEPLLAPTGSVALEMIRSSPPDAILCDHRMAGMNGTEFHDAVAATAPELGRRFAFMSGDVLNPELREFATSRGILLLAKPFDIATVGRTVAALLGSEPAA
jgi:PAS domain S-box-containing protein